MSRSHRTLSRLPAHNGFDCARCVGRGECLTHPDRDGRTQWQECYACDGTGSVLPQYRDRFGERGTESARVRAEWHAALEAAVKRWEVR